MIVYLLSWFEQTYNQYCVLCVVYWYGWRPKRWWNNIHLSADTINSNNSISSSTSLLRLSVSISMWMEQVNRFESNANHIQSQNRKIASKTPIECKVCVCTQCIGGVELNNCTSSHTLAYVHIKRPRIKVNVRGFGCWLICVSMCLLHRCVACATAIHACMYVSVLRMRVLVC